MSDANRQERVFANLHDRSPRLAGVYRTALRALKAAPEAGCEVARVSVICHCMRELILGLPPVLTDSSIPRPDPSSGVLLAKLPRLLADHPDVDLNADQDVVPVPRELAAHLDTLIQTRTREDGRNRRNTAALVADDSAGEHPAIKQWQDAYRFFVRWAHLDRDDGSEPALPSDKSIEGNIRVVEDVVEVRTAAFFENLHSLRDLLHEINATDGGSA